MKVLQISTPFLPVTPELEYGGSERVIYLLDEGLYSRGLSAGVVAPSESLPKSSLYPTIARAIGVDDVLDNSKNSAFTGFALRAAHVSEAIYYSNSLGEVDVVHLHDDNMLPFDFLIDKPSLLTLHSDIESFWDLSVTPFLKKRKSKLVAISQNQKKINEAKGHKIDYVVYNGVDEDKFSIAEKIYPYILTLGSIRPVKGQDVAIEIAKKTGLDLIIAGNIGDSKFFETEIKPSITHNLINEQDKLAAYLSLPKDSLKIVYVGSVNDKQKAPLYSHTTTFLMPIRWEEPFGLVMVEAMMSGRPTVAYNLGSISEVIQEDTGTIVPADNLEEMVKSIENLTNFNSNLCRLKAIERFGKNRMVENYIKVYKDILG